MSYDPIAAAALHEVAEMRRRLEVAQRMADAARELADDIADRFDMDSPSTNPGMKSAVKEARAALADWEATR